MGGESLLLALDTHLPAALCGDPSRGEGHSGQLRVGLTRTQLLEPHQTSTL